MNKAYIKGIIKEKALILKRENNNFLFTSSNGNWIFDFRKAFLHGKSLNDFSVFFWDKYENEYPFQIGGLELGAIPFISGLVLEGYKRGKNINSFFVRKERKESGLGNKIEGNISDEKIIIVDDLFNSGNSIQKVNDTIIGYNKCIHKIFVFVSFGNEKGRKYLNDNNLNLDFEFSLSDFGLDIFGNSQIIKKDTNKSPVIFPKFQKLYNGKNANQFLLTMKSNPLKDGKSIYFGTESGEFLCICSDTGKINWKFVINPTRGHKNILSSAIIISGYICFGAYDGNFYCLDKNTGILKWKFIDADWIGSSATYSSKYNQIYIGLEHAGINNNGSVVGLDIDTGEKKWEVFFDDFIHCSPGYSEKTGLVICGGNDGKLLSIRGDNGEILFTKNISNPIKGGFSFSEDGKIAYFGCFDSNMYSINLLNGNINWLYKTNNTIYTTPLSVGNNLFFGSLDKNFYHLDINGKLIQKIETFGKIFSQPILIEKNIISFASNDSYIYFYDLLVKKVLFVIEHKERINTSLIYDNKFKHIYVYDIMNSLYKYDLNSYLD